MPYRTSKYIDFDTGTVKIAPMDLKKSLIRPWTDDQKLDLFECRVDVWTLGVAVALLHEIDHGKKGSIWQHAAYGLLTISFTYFEMIGKTLNPNSATSGTASEDFNVGFCDVYRCRSDRFDAGTDSVEPSPPFDAVQADRPTKET